MGVLQNIDLSTKELGIFLRLKRKTRQMSQKDLGKLVGVTQSAISEIEHGTYSDIKLPLLISILNALMVSAQEVYSFFILHDIKEANLYEAISSLEHKLKQADKTKLKLEQDKNDLKSTIKDLKCKLRGKNTSITLILKSKQKLLKSDQRNKVLLSKIRSIKKKELLEEVIDKNEIIADLKYENTALSKENKEIRQLYLKQKAQLELIKAELFRLNGLEYHSIPDKSSIL